ncbi:MAG TPA: J domain-containing protein [Nitrososphaeraceae archaeon]|nr:J domain-containing protein [Nitrososphaeraceae archaeon]
MINHYEVLGVSNNASQADIRRSFRYLALKHHPDKNRNSEESKQKFMQIVEAYEILSDEQARKNYDMAASYNHYDNHYQQAHYTSYSRKNSKNTTRQWTPSADFGTVYSYEEIKRKYRQSRVQGGIWDISESASTGMWKATLILFGGLAAIVLFIMLLH